MIRSYICLSIIIHVTLHPKFLINDQMEEMDDITLGEILIRMRSERRANTDRRANTAAAANDHEAGTSSGVNAEEPYVPIIHEAGTSGVGDMQFDTAHDPLLDNLFDF